jgi:transcriptional regulator with AAA-type ATPase domain/tetratricopeptide (TPR) repeat protein
MTAPLDVLLGTSPSIVAIRTQVEQVLARQTGARRPLPILILGETGTGKGLLAGAIHQAGPRCAGPFVTVNCAAIPETLLEAELLGYERGAFTDARQAKPGLFQTAHGGTLFLDEIGLLPAAVQGKLLTVLEDRAVRRLGSTRADPVDVAVVAATSVELQRAIGEGRFREDLYHRLAVISFELPPLRTRGGDILELADYFLARACADYGLSARTLTPAARDRLVAYRWPGNVRELANTLERVALLSTTNEITATMLDFLARRPADGPDARGSTDPGSLDHVIRGRIEHALRDAGGSIRRAAVALGISRNTLRARMDKYGLRDREAVLRSPPPTAPSPDRSLPPEWEHRHLAFLRARVLPSSTVDVSRALDMISEKLESFGGRIEESSPTGLLAVFGLEPLENAPSHAALAALAIHNAAAPARTPSSGRVDVVISIDCDHHIVRRQRSTFDIALGGKAATWPILEDLVAIDSPASTVVTEAVVPFVTRGFVLERLRDPGRNAWMLLRREEAPIPWARFVGRTSELALLRLASARAEQRHGQVVGIVGEAGIGKSRLLHEAVRSLHGWRILSSAGAPYATNTSYFPLVEVLKSFCHIQDTDTAAEVRERVARSLPPRADDPERLMPPLLDLLGVLLPDDAFRAIDPALRRARTHEALRQMVLAASVAQPVCLIIEDLHWIDFETREVLDRLVDGLPAARVLLLMNYRPEYQHPWVNKTYYSTVRLDALPADSAAELLDALLGNDTGLATLKQRLIGLGNPFFLEEKVRMLVETGALVGERGAYRLTRPVEPLLVPATVQTILAARIDRLSAADKQLLLAASVIGKDVPYVLLAAIAAQPDEELRRGLGRLEAAEFLQETQLFPDREFTFKHALTHEVTYRSLLQERRRALHARVVHAIETVYRDRLGQQIERLAHHAVRAELREDAVRYLRQAGLKAVARSAFPDARAWLEQALDVLASLPETLSTLERALDIRLELPQTLIQLGELPRALTRLLEAETLAEQLKDDHRRGRVYTFMAIVHVLLGELDEALVAGTRALEITARLGDLTLRIPATTSLEQVHFYRGEHERVVALATANLAVLPADQVSEDFGLAAPPSIYDRGRLIISLAELGRFAEAAGPAAEVIRLAARTQHAYTVGWAHLATAWVHLQRGEWAQAHPLLERATAALRTGNVAILLPFAVALSSWVLAQLGDAPEAMSRVRKGEQLFDHHTASGYIGTLGWLSTWLGRAALVLGRLDEARWAGDRALQSCSRHPGFLAHALHLRGDIASHPDQFDAESGEAHYRQALALAAPLGMRPLVAHCQLGLGALYRLTGKRAQAHQQVATATAMYREMGMTYWLEQAEAREHA